jgi:hypothetical protein
MIHGVDAGFQMQELRAGDEGRTKKVLIAVAAAVEGQAPG